MGKIWLTSDLHFSHNRDFLWQPRGFENIYEHNETIIKNFNEVVGWDDDLYILGDCFLNDNEEGMKCMRRLPGRLHIIWGNHDTLTRQTLLSNEPRVIIHGYADIIKYNNYHFYLSHYPTITTNFDDDKKFKARLFSLSGHTHSKAIWQPACESSYNVALDAHNNYPVDIDIIINDLKEKYCNV